MKKSVKKIVEKKTSRKINWVVLLSCFLIVFFVAFVGSMFTSGKTNSEWYNSIKPAITPPNYVFPIAWTILFVLIALSLYFVWIACKTGKEKKKVALTFGINLILNATWSYLYFTLQNPLSAFFCILAILMSIFLMISTSWRINKIAAKLLIPYLLWVSFATILNFLSI